MENHNTIQSAEHDEKALHFSHELPLLPLKNAVIYPYISMPVSVSGPHTTELLKDVQEGEGLLGVLTQKTAQSDGSSVEDLYTVGAVVKLLKTIQSPKGERYILVQGVSRMRVLEFLQEKPYYIGQIEEVPERLEEGKELTALVGNLKHLLESISKISDKESRDMMEFIMQVKEPGLLADLVAENPNFSLEERQELLETADVKLRLQKVTLWLTREKENLKLHQKIQSQVQNTMDKTQREYYLREQLRIIQKELGEKDTQLTEQEELRKRLEASVLPEDARKTAEKEFERLIKMNPASSEYTVGRNYLDWILDLPWDIHTEDKLELGQAQEVLEADHYGLENVKKRILEYLAVRQLTDQTKGPILCFVGPPGVGKTSLGQSIARALNRKFVRIALGGVRDEAEIRGHRRTYVGALPGRFIQALKKAGSNNPVVLLDEIDKVGTDFRGDPASALLEVLDPEQNNRFSDHYLELDFDLSKVMFITTANQLATIPGPLLDRMEVINIPGYTEEEKVHIAQKYLVPRQLTANGLNKEQLTIEESALKTLIRSYTREAGVRNLEREIGTVCRGVVKEIVDGSAEGEVVSEESLSKFLGPIKFFSEIAERIAQPGVVTGLAWTPVGGDILFVEALKMKGHEKLILTGQLGSVMKESAEIAMSYLRSKAGELGLPEDFSDNTDVHVHVPSGSIPKDGPSAGVTLYTSLASLFSDKPVRSDVAMTGEVTLRGLVLPVGGIKEKVLAARSAGVKHIILPAKNEKDMDDIPENIKQELSFHFVKNMDEVLQFALESSN